MYKHKHHIVFRSNGGLDFPLNIMELTTEEHLGYSGPHLNNKVDRMYKLKLQKRLFQIFTKETYSIEEIASKLERPKSVNYFTKAFKTVPMAAGQYEQYEREDIVRRLMGGKLYLVEGEIHGYK